MKVKTSELTGAALDWAVATCNGVECDEDNEPIWFESDVPYAPRCPYQPSKDWAQGGPIIEREKMQVRFVQECYWYFTTPTDTWLANYVGVGEWLGPTPLIAAMRCYVASCLGQEVEIPEELV
jgi:hypothetical protein